MTIKDEILKRIDEEGSFCVGGKNLYYYDAVDELVKDGEIKSIADLGIKFFNEHYIYTRADNRYNLTVEKAKNWVQLVKGITQ